jgi:autonomous glycyl radical cofactor GrcA
MGAAGFAGVELVRLLSQHPHFEVKVITSDADAGKRLEETYPAFTGSALPPFTGHDDPALFECDLVFLAVPHTVALKYAPPLLDGGVTVIDLSADYRLKDPAVYEKWYGTPHTSQTVLADAEFDDVGMLDLSLPYVKGGGQLREVLADYIRTVLSLRIPVLQTNMTDKKLLLEERERKGTHPELVVRVCGYSALFSELPPEMQDEIIARVG